MILARRSPGFLICALIFSFTLVITAFACSQIRRLGLDPERVYRITVPSHVRWTDTGCDVRAGDVIYFKASGGITLQQGNPMAYCGPDGINLQTVQQPIRNKNFGAVIGRILMLVSVEVDEETGEETREEIVRYFYIGESQRVEMPIDGSLYLGVNELVVDDNSGEFTVEMYLLEKGGL